ncbi:MAG: hypothetical protein WAO22_09530 [bacterium]|jgi:hypothetical protein|nr:hypothetical protein [Bacillota bacterium]
MNEQCEEMIFPASVLGSATFLVKIMYTQNSSTQGMVQWIDEDKTVHFRSFLELVSLLTEALQNKGRLTTLRSWEKSAPERLSRKVEGQ